jgi:hypothetical protein
MLRQQGLERRGVSSAGIRSQDVRTVARIERSEIRKRLISTAKPPQVSLALNPGYSRSGTAGAARIASEPESKA